LLQWSVYKWIKQLKMVTFLEKKSLVTKHGSIIASRIVNGRVWNRNVQSLGLTWPNTGTLSVEGHNNKLVTVRCLLRFEANAGDYCREVSLIIFWGAVNRNSIIVFLHDNTRSHTAARTAEILQKLKFDVMAHPLYSLDLTPFDYHLSGPLKKVLRGRRFTSDQEVKEAGHA
jgi:hypothetical protein